MKKINKLYWLVYKLYHKIWNPILKERPWIAAGIANFMQKQLVEQYGAEQYLEWVGDCNKIDNEYKKEKGILPKY